jgi:predicted 3-demethylubiquinone-9 3-methyltransferase (glyoxalase superfamily)
MPTNAITPFFWFESQAEQAAQLYVSIFRNSRILSTTRHGEGVISVAFELDGQRFVALNGAPQIKFTEAVSFCVDCKTQEEVDHFWDKLSAGGEPGQCGWLKDRFGVSWQIVPTVLPELLGDPDPKKAGRAVQAMLKMKKLDIAALKKAHQGD